MGNVSANVTVVSPELIAVLWGAAVGGLWAFVIYGYLVIARPLRQRRNWVAIGLGYALAFGSIFASFWLLEIGSKHLGITDRAFWPYKESGFGTSFVIGSLFGIWKESQWQKSIGVWRQRKTG